MFFGAQAFGEFAYTELEDAHDLSTPDPARLLLADLAADFVFVLESSPFYFNPAGAVGFPYPWMHIPLLHIPDAELIFDNAIYISDVGFNSGPTDTPPNKNMVARLKQSYDFNTSIAQPSGGSVRGSTSFGRIIFNNSDRELDFLTQMVWGGEEALIKVGGTFNLGLSDENTLLYKEFGTIFKGIVDQAEWDTSNITLIMRNFGEKISKNVQSTLYLGTGGLEGTVNIEGQPKPLAYGVIKNALPTLVDEVKLIYQFHDGSMNSITAVRDKGVALSFNQNVADIEAADGTLGTGEYNTSLANGYIRLGASADGQITGDITGDNSGAGYIDQVDEIIRRIAVDKGGLNDPADIDTVAFTALNASHTQVVGYYTGSSSQAMDEIFNFLVPSIDAFWSFNRTGLLTIGTYDDPDRTSSLQTLTESDMKLDGLTKVPALPPVWRYTIGYEKMWHVQNASDLAAVVSDADKNKYSNEFRTDIVQNTATLSRYPDAREVRIDTGLNLISDAASEASDRLTRDKISRSIYRFTRVKSLFQHQIGDTLTVEVPKFNLDLGKNFIVIGFRENTNTRNTEIILYG